MTVLEHWFEEVWNKQNAAAIDELWLFDRTTNGLALNPGKDVKTRDEFKAFHKLLCAAFSDIHISVEDTVSEGDRTVARVHVTGVHTGPGMPMPPTGKRIAFSGMCMARVKDGKVVESWNNFDFMTMYKQLE
jgi:predicted ester cyclase